MRAKYIIVAIVLISVGVIGIVVLKYVKGKSSYTVRNQGKDGALTTERRYHRQNAPEDFYEIPQRRNEMPYVPPDPKLDREALPVRERTPPSKETAQDDEPVPPTDPQGDFLIPTPEMLERLAEDTKSKIAPALPLIVEPAGRDGRPTNEVRSARWIPSHRLIPCRLVSTIETRNMQSPVIALTTANVYHHGRLIVPANTEIHGTVGASREGDRVAANNAWRFVFGHGVNDPDNGKEMAFSAVVLHSATDDDSKQQELSAGFRGVLCERDPDELKKLFGYTALREGYNLAKDATLNRQQNTGDGLQLNNVGQATDAPIDRWIDNQFQRLGNDSYFLRVAGGTAFYLYTTQPIDVGTATINNAAQPLATTGNQAAPSAPAPSR